MSCPLCRRYVNIPAREANSRLLSGFLTTDQLELLVAGLTRHGVAKQYAAGSLRYTCEVCLVGLMAEAV